MDEGKKKPKEPKIPLERVGSYAVGEDMAKRELKEKKKKSK